MLETPRIHCGCGGIAAEAVWPHHEAVNAIEFGYEAYQEKCKHNSSGNNK